MAVSNYLATPKITCNFNFCNKNIIYNILCELSQSKIFNVVLLDDKLILKPSLKKKVNFETYIIFFVWLVLFL